MRIAIVRLSALGDIINSTFILSFIKSKHPDASIDWICEELFAPILDHNPYLNAIHTVRLKKDRSIKGIYHTIKKLKALGPYDLVIDLQGLIKSALVSRFLGKKRFGFDKNSIREPLAAFFYTHKATIPYIENSLWRTAFLVNKALDTQITQADLTHLKPSLFYESNTLINPLLKEEKNIVFVVGSSQAYKNYPVEKIIETINLLKIHTILIWGSMQEHDDALRIHQACPNSSISQRLEFNNLIQLIDKVELTIGSDTGPTHIAFALAKKSITLFGATPASKMMWQTPKNIAIESQSHVDSSKLDKSDFSIAEIEPAQIVDEALRLLDV